MVLFDAIKKLKNLNQLIGFCKANSFAWKIQSTESSSESVIIPAMVENEAIEFYCAADGYQLMAKSQKDIFKISIYSISNLS